MQLANGYSIGLFKVPLPAFPSSRAKLSRKPCNSSGPMEPSKAVPTPFFTPWKPRHPNSSEFARCDACQVLCRWRAGLTDSFHDTEHSFGISIACAGRGGIWQFRQRGWRSDSYRAAKPRRILKDDFTFVHEGLLFVKNAARQNLTVFVHKTLSAPKTGPISRFLITR